MMSTQSHNAREVARAPISLAEFEEMKRSALFGDDDVHWLRVSRGIVAVQVEQILDVWYGFIGSQPQLVKSFAPAGGKPDGDYLAAVRRRFAQWILDTASATYDQTWLDYQFEIGRRHHRIGKNKTDNVKAAPIVEFRHLFPVVVPVVTTLKPFLAKKGHSPEDVEKMHAAWVKSILLQLTLWSFPYIKGGDF